jgi:hypothetical protein
METHVPIRSSGSRQAFLRRQPRSLELWQSLPISSKLFLVCALAYTVASTTFAAVYFGRVRHGLQRLSWCMAQEIPGVLQGKVSQEPRLHSSIKQDG